MSLVNTNELFEFRVQGGDGEVGRIKDVYFDDRSFDVRYFVVDSRKWLPGRRVLLSPAVFNGWDFKGSTVRTPLTQDQIRNAPPMDSRLPVSREVESRLAAYYGWPMYWMGASREEALGLGPNLAHAGGVPFRRPLREELADAEKQTRLRSLKEVEHYRVMATGEEVGSICGALIHTSNDSMPYLMVDLGTWFSPDPVVFPVDRVREMDVLKNELTVDVEAHVLKEAPRVTVRELHGRRERELIEHYSQTRTAVPRRASHR